MMKLSICLINTIRMGVNRGVAISRTEKELKESFIMPVGSGNIL